MASIWQRCHVKRIKKYHWFNRYVNADGREKVNFCENFRNCYVRIRTYNARKYLEETCRWKFNARNCTRKISFLRKFLFFTCVNVRRKKRDSANPPLEKYLAVENGNVKSTHVIARVKYHFYLRFYFLLTLTCVDKNATVEIQLWRAKKITKLS